MPQHSPHHSPHDDTHDHAGDDASLRDESRDEGRHDESRDGGGHEPDDARDAGVPEPRGTRISSRGGSEAEPARGDVPARESTVDDQVSRELTPGDVPDSGEPGNPNVPPTEMGIDVARLFEQASEQTRMAICVTDPKIADNPIVYVNQAFVTMTGYGREDVVGRNCRLLQGEDTDPADVAAIRAALDAREVRVVEILNYRKDGTPFWNSLHVGPIYDDAGRLTHFYGSQWDVTAARSEREALVRERQRSAVRRQVAEELQHRTNNLFAVLNAIVRLSARGETDAAALKERVTERIEAMARAHEASIAPGGVAGAPADLRTLAEAVLRPYRTEAEARIELSGPDIVLPEAAVTPLGLALHELATNALKYGALGVAEGRVELRWDLDGGGDDAPDANARGTRDLRATWTEMAGPVPAHATGGAATGGAATGGAAGGEAEGTGTGTRLVRGVLRAVEGSIGYDWRPTGLVVTLRLPLPAPRDAAALEPPGVAERRTG